MEGGSGVDGEAGDLEKSDVPATGAAGVWCSGAPASSAADSRISTITAEYLQGKLR